MPRLNSKSTVSLHGDVSSPFSEAYRTLKINIDFAAVGLTVSIATIAVTSAAPGEGKTTTALQLAAAYARGGKNALLVDGDIRKPSLHSLTGRGGGIGLTDYLADPNTVLFDIVHDSPLERMSVMTAGTPVPNPSDLLASDRLDSLLQELKRRYDVIVIDTPPVLGAIDAKIVASKCDGVLFVVEGGKVKRDAAKKALDELNQAKARILGATLTKVHRKDAQKYPYYS
ncbi:CpsD/CapB family tyrosine-protein kinase [Paenibacillus sp.]|uniref:CpsD/CapB family tyrosine-protein kinase n=1 Tax=Paenibacillus sp. TaxID=58172 RepID=UPI002810B9E7|nr:CpsD/CapB family tyrosine-protein kinase [Paenibacillus sp.]